MERGFRDNYQSFKSEGLKEEDVLGCNEKMCDVLLEVFMNCLHKYILYVLFQGGVTTVNLNTSSRINELVDKLGGKEQYEQLTDDDAINLLTKYLTKKHEEETRKNPDRPTQTAKETAELVDNSWTNWAKKNPWKATALGAAVAIPTVAAAGYLAAPAATAAVVNNGVGLGKAFVNKGAGLGKALFNKGAGYLGLYGAGSVAADAATDTTVNTAVDAVTSGGWLGSLFSS
jgi:hypothetical protein